jgi:hypothetical protein
MHRVFPVFYVEAKFGHSDKRIQKIDTNADEIFQKNIRYALFDHKRNEEIWKS